MSEGTRNAGYASHRGANPEERKMIDNHVHCETCGEDGLGQWKHFTEFFTDHERSRGLSKRCKVCVKNKVYAPKPPAKRKRVQVADVDALNKVRFQTSEKLEPAHSLSTYLASKAWTKELTFEGVTA